MSKACNCNAVAYGVPNGTKSHHYYINLRTLTIFMLAAPICISEFLFVYQSSYLLYKNSYLYFRVPIYIRVPICISELLLIISEFLFVFQSSYLYLNSYYVA